MLKLEKKHEERKVQVIVATKNRAINYEANIWKSYLFHLFTGFFLISGVLIPFFLTWGKLTFFEVMLLQSYFTIMIFLFEIPCGAIADYLSRKASLFLGALAIAIAGLIYGSIPNLFIFMIGETFFALGFAFISGTDEALVYDTLKKMEREEEMPKIMGKNKSFFLVGIGISAPLGSILALFVQINLIMTLMFIPFLIAAFIAISFKEPNHDLERKTKGYFSVIRSGIKELKNNKNLRILAMDLILVEALVLFIIWMYQLYFDYLSVPLVFFGFVAASMTLSEIICTNLLPKFERHYKNKKSILTIYTLIPGIAYILIAFIFFAPIVIALVLIVIGFGFSRRIIFINGINKEIETENRATVLSTISMIGNIIRTVLYPIVGILVMWSLNYTFIILGISVILMALVSQVKNEHL